MSTAETTVTTTASFNVYKELTLRVRIQAENDEAAIEKMLNLHDSHFEVVECEHFAVPISGKEIPSETTEATVRAAMETAERTDAPAAQPAEVDPAMKQAFIGVLRYVVEQEYPELDPHSPGGDPDDLKGTLANAIETTAALLNIEAPEDHPNPAEHDGTFYDWAAEAGFEYGREDDQD